ncbi:MAG: PASTA domain-containing protein [Prevotellaceae bacterium]|jgi:cell division protein FtsI (penicillin-binding protein 3)|nr:PASTA domain-containing protein [Prevotellaceae bacterium]
MKVTDKIYKWTIFLYRFFFIFALYCIGFAIYVIFNPKMQKAEKAARKSIVNSTNIRRGDILTADGNPLASYRPEYVLYTDFGVRIDTNYTIDEKKVRTGKNVKNPVKLDTFRINIYKEYAKLLSRAIGGNASDYYRELYNYRLKAEEEKKSQKTTNKEWYTEDILKYKIGVFQRDMIIENPYLKKRGRNVTGIYAKETGRKRIYPLGDNFAHSAIGVIGEETVSGIENMYNEELTNGDDVLTTIDTRIQDICETVLRDKIAGDQRLVGGAVIVMDVATGDIKAMANIGAYYKGDYSDINDIYNNATKATIEPGSTFKTVSLMLALETGKINLSDKVSAEFWRGRKISANPVNDTMLTVSRIIEQSKNAGTGNIVDKAFDRNTGMFVQAIENLKLFDRIEKMDETRASINRVRNEESMLKISHGYQVKFAPIHTLMFYNAIANDGVMLKPRLVRGLLKRTTGETEIFKPEIANKAICSKSTLDSVRLVLSRVVGRGSARRIAGSPYGIVGKTGTAEIWLEDVNSYKTAAGKREISSFCGYFPQKSPKYSCIVTLYTKFLDSVKMKEFSASSTAVPLFRKVSDKIYALYFDKEFTPAGAAIDMPVIKNTQGKNLSIILEELNLPIPDEEHTWVKVNTSDRQLQISGLPQKKEIVPDVTGMGLRDAVFLLENRGLKVSYSGLGTVVKQSPEQGAQYNSGQKIHLILGEL